MASCHFVCLALVVALSISTLEMAAGAGSLATTTHPNDEAESFKKHIAVPRFKIPHKEPPIKLPWPWPKLKIPLKKHITLPKVTVHPSHPKTQNGVEQSLVPSFPRNFRFPRNFGIKFPPLAPYLSSPSLPFPDMPLVPAIPFTPPYVPVSDQTSPTASKKANDQSP